MATKKTTTLKLTTNELAERLKLDRTIVYGLVKYLEATGLAKIVETRPNPTGKGKGSFVYEIPVQVVINL